MKLPRIRITSGHMADWRFDKEVSVSITGHCEERFETIVGDEAHVTVYPVRPFSINRRRVDIAHRIAGRPQGRKVIELVWSTS